MPESSTALAPAEQTNGERVVMPRQVGVAAEQHRAVAEIQAALAAARMSPRNEVAAIDRITTACQRHGLAEKAEYVYSRGGTDITGPTIDLLTVIANAWGNIWVGFRELTQANGESTVEAFAWDLETNAKRTVVFTVAHKRVTKKGSFPLTDPRDVYELVANQAQRRVRSCLEAIVPPDVVDDALQECKRTLEAKAQVTTESLAALVKAFAEFGVTKEHIEERLGRRLEAMQPAQLVNMRRIYKSLKDGMSKPGEWFPIEGAEPAGQTATDAAKEALRRQAAAGAEAAAQPTPAAAPEVRQAPDVPVAPSAERRTAPPKKLSKASLHRIAERSQKLPPDEFAVILEQEYDVSDPAQLDQDQADALIKRLEK